MSVQRPEHVHPLFSAAFNKGDLDGLMALYEPEAALGSQADQVASYK